MMIKVESFEDSDSGMGVSLRELGRGEVFFLSYYDYFIIIIIIIFQVGSYFN